MTGTTPLREVDSLPQDSDKGEEAETNEKYEYHAYASLLSMTPSFLALVSAAR
ncbi:MAG: hypothetical protein LYZ66_02030 [Nitrososphaerales archaeon]|nr:hypothetical protein [Nitrososphaerales archaeon]